MSDNEWNFGTMDGRPEDLDDFMNPASGRLRTQNGQPATGSTIDNGLEDLAARQAFRTNLKERSEHLCRVIKDRASSYTEKLEAITAMLTEIIPVMVLEVTSVSPNPDVSLAISRTTSLLKELSSQFEKSEKHRLDQTINPASPRFQEAFQMFLGDVFNSIDDAGLPQNYKDAFMNSFSDRLRGFESRVESLNTASALSRSKIATSAKTQEIMASGKEPMSTARMN